MILYMLYMASPILIGLLFHLNRNVDLVHNDRDRRVYLFINFLLMCIMFCLRHYRVGSNDGIFYYRNWIRMSHVSAGNVLRTIQAIDIENGYLISVWALSHIFHHPQFVFVCSGIFISWSICRFLYRHAPDVVLGLLMFLCLGFFNFWVQGLRQAIAIGICLFALDKAQERKLIPFLLLVLLASFYHASAIAFVPVYFICAMKINLRDTTLFLTFCVVGSASIGLLFDVMNYVINDHFQITGGINDGSGVVTLLIFLLIFAFSAFVYRKKEKDAEYTLFFYLSIAGALIFSMRNFVSGIVERVSNFYSLGQIALLTRSLPELSPKERHIIRMLAMLLSLAFALHKAKYSRLVPYLLFWQA